VNVKLSAVDVAAALLGDTVMVPDPFAATTKSDASPGVPLDPAAAAVPRWLVTLLTVYVVELTVFPP
jgi:hypothetical protein